jgi:hypothetical protein
MFIPIQIASDEFPQLSILLTPDMIMLRTANLRLSSHLSLLPFTRQNVLQAQLNVRIDATMCLSRFRQAGCLAGAQESRVPAGGEFDSRPQSERIGIPSVLGMGCKPCIHACTFELFVYKYSYLHLC